MHHMFILLSKGVREEAMRRVAVPRERAFIPGLSEPAQREIVGQ